MPFSISLSSLEFSSSSSTICTCVVPVCVLRSLGSSISSVSTATGSSSFFGFVFIVILSVLSSAFLLSNFSTAFFGVLFLTLLFAADAFATLRFFATLLFFTFTGTSSYAGIIRSSYDGLNGFVKIFFITLMIGLKDIPVIENFFFLLLLLRKKSKLKSSSTINTTDRESIISQKSHIPALPIYGNKNEYISSEILPLAGLSNIKAGKTTIEKKNRSHPV